MGSFRRTSPARLRTSGRAANLIKEVFQNTNDEAFSCLNTNYYGCKRVTEALLPLLKLSTSRARIVNASSLASELKAPKTANISDIVRAKQCGMAYFQSFEHICLDICPGQGSELLLSPHTWLPFELRLLKFGIESSVGVPPFHRGFCTLDKLEIRGCPKLEALMDLEELKVLQSLVIADCPSLYILPEMKFPPLLGSLTVEGCHKLQSLPLNISDASVFTELEVTDCQGLMYIPSLGPLSNLESLVLLHCPLLELQEPFASYS